MKEKLEKIKALALDAEGTEEGIAALLLYQRLLEKSEYDDSDIGQDSNEVVRLEVYSAGRISQGIKGLASVIPQHFRCITYLERHPGEMKIMYAGHPDDVNLAIETFNTALMVIIENVNRKRKNEQMSKSSVSSYYHGFSFGLDMAFKEQEESGSLSIIITTPPEVNAIAQNFKIHKYDASIDDPVLFMKGELDGKDFLKRKRLNE